MASQLNSQQNNVHIVYIISTNFNAQHIQSLIKEFNNKNIPIRLQADHESLGVILDRRYFVIVDNLSGTIKLSPWFSSLLLYIVGYPKKGKNKKNHYCQTKQSVMQKYQEFCALPEFVKVNYLSSSVTSKSMLKSSISIRSNSKTPSQNMSVKNRNKLQNKAKEINHQKEKNKVQNKIEKMNNLNIPKMHKIDEKSKLFLFLSIGDAVYNKWLLRIAANNRKKFTLVQSIEDLSLNISLLRTKQSFLVINYSQYKKILDLAINNLKLIIYAKQQPYENEESLQKCQNVLQVCSSQSEIINAIRNIGFQVLSLKDIDKSIVKYDNPFTKQVKSNTHRRIIWNNSQTKNQLQNKTNSFSSNANDHERDYALKENKKINLNEKQKSVQSEQQSNKISSLIRSISTQSAPINGVQKKRMSIQSNVRRSQEQYNKNKHSQYTDGDYIFKQTTPVRLRRFSNAEQKKFPYSTQPISISKNSQSKENMLKKSLIYQVPVVTPSNQSQKLGEDKLSQSNSKKVIKKIKIKKCKNDKKDESTNSNQHHNNANDNQSVNEKESESENIDEYIERIEKKQRSQSQLLLSKKNLLVQKVKIKTNAVEPYTYNITEKSSKLLINQHNQKRQIIMSSLLSKNKIQQEICSKKENQSQKQQNQQLKKQSKRQIQDRKVLGQYQNMLPSSQSNIKNNPSITYSKKLRKQVLRIEQEQQKQNRKKSYRVQKYTNQYQIYNNVQRYQVYKNYYKDVEQYNQCHNDNNVSPDSYSNWSIDIENCLLLWKDFNFQIQNNKKYVKEYLNQMHNYCALKQKSFCTIKQFKNSLIKAYNENKQLIKQQNREQHEKQANKIQYLIILLDQMQLQQYLQCLKQVKQHENNSDIQMIIYVFSKHQSYDYQNGGSHAQLIKKIKQAVKIKQLQFMRKVIKPVLLDQYYGEGLEAAQQIISFMNHKNNKYNKNASHNADNNSHISKSNNTADSNGSKKRAQQIAW